MTSRISLLGALFIVLLAFLARPLGAQSNLVGNPGFESGATALDGMPTVAGVWGGDQNTIVTAENGITPMAGTRMVKFVRSAPTADPSNGDSADAIQLVDLSAFAAQIAAGTARFRLSASFNRVAGDATTDTRFQVEINAYAGSPASFTDSLTPLARVVSGIDSDANLATWQAAAVDLVMPVGTTYVGLWVSAVENVQNDALGATEFAAHYADGVAFGLVPADGIRALANMSTMATAGASGMGALASNFTIEGTTPKTVLIRGVGPKLGDLGFTGFLVDPVLVVYNGFGQRVAENDNWGSAATSSALASAASTVGASSLVDGSKDAALLLTLAPGTYYARVDGASGGTGTALLEVYDADTSSRLVNLSTNHRIAAANGGVSSGLVITGNVAQTVLVRAVGPALTAAGVLGMAADPTLTVFSGSANLASNNNWGSAAASPALAAAAATAGMRPLADGSADAALLLTLAPGAYTIQATAPAVGNVVLEVAQIDSARAATIAPALIAPVVAVAGAQGGGFRLNAPALGNPAPTYQWSKNGTAIAGATTPALILSDLAGPDAANYSVTISNTVGSVIAPALSGTVWSLAHPSTLTGSFNSVAYSGSVYAAAGDGGMIFTSINGTTWSRITPPSGTITRSIAFGGGRFVAVANSGVVRYSTDQGATWPTGTSGTTQHLLGVIHDGTRFVAVGANSTVLHSTDGQTWTAGNLGTASITLNAVAYKPSGNYVAVASNGTIYHTADVTTGSWTALPTSSAGSNTTNGFNAVAYLNDRFVAVGNSGTIRTSTTGAGAWNTITSPTTNTLRAVAYNGTVYVATGGNTLVTSTSADASSWTAASILPVGTANSNALIFAGGQFVSAGFPGTIVTSPSGAANTWTLRTAPTTANFNDAVYAGGRYVAVGSNAAIYTSADGAAGTALAPALPSHSSTTLRRVAYGAGRYVAVGDAGTILVSTDAVTWLNRSFGTTAYTALTYGAGKFVAAGDGGTYVTSVDGSVWTPGTGTIGTAPVNGLAFGGATPVFVAVVVGGGIYTSPDAVTWTAQTSNTANTLNNVRFAGGQFVALGASSTLLTSPNGTAWTHRAVGASGINLVDLAHGGGYNVLVHTTSGSPNNGIVFVSQDTVTWSPVLLGGSLGTPVNFFAQAAVTYGNGSFLIASNSGIVARSLPNTGLQRILTQPVAATTIPAGGSATLSVATSATSGSTFQWYRGASGDTSTPIAGATGASYTASASDRYWVQVAGASSPPIASATAAVTGPAPTITTQPIATTITAGQGGTLSVVAVSTGAGPLTYQWRKFGSALAGANGTSLALDATTFPDAGYYDVVVSDGLASVTSKSVRVDIAPAAANYGNVYRPRANAPRIEANTGNITAIAVDPADSNKIYVAGEFTRINSTVRLNVARFLANGDFDSSWAPVSIIGGGSIRALLVEADGLIIAGDFTSVGGTPRGRLAKLSKTDGSLVTSFASAAAASSSIYTLARQVMADASVRYLVGGNFSTFNGTTVNRLIRIDTAGVIDPSFVISPSGTAGFGSDVRTLVVDGSGDTAKIYAGGTFTSHHGVTTNRNRLVRLTAHGAYDSTFDVGSGFNNTVTSLALSGTGASAKLYVGGLFTSVKGLSTTAASPSGTITLSRMVRLDAAGSIDNTFAVGTSFGSDVNALALDSTGRIYVGGAFTSFNGTTTNRSRLLRLTATGAFDTAFNNALSGANSTVNTLLLQEDTTTPANSRLLFGGFFTTWNNNARDSFARVATDATAALDTAPAATFRRPGTVYAVEPAPGGRWYIGGSFNFIDDQARNHFARLNADGTLDTGFTHAGTGFNSSVNALAVQGDGRIVAAGNFTFFGSTARNDILRLHPDGTLDPSFNPGSGFTANVNALQLLPDGRIVAAGNFTSYNGTTRNRLARLRSDGALDTTFDPVAGFTTNFNAPAPLALQADGKLLVGGTFTTYNGTTANGLVRVLDTGLIDPAYNPGGAGFASNIDVRQIVTRLDDELVVSGGFTTYNGTARSRIARITDTGALDTVFAPNTGANNTVTAFHVQPDDKTILAGFYNAVLGVTRPVFSRFTATGTLDSAFIVPTVINPFNTINVIRPDAAGNLLVATTRLDFTEFLGRGSLVVLEPAPVPAITAPPVAQSAVAGGSATFAVTATGENLTYQWRKDGIALAGATNASLALSNLTFADVGNYSVVVANAYGSIASVAVPLTGSAAPPTIVTAPLPAATAVGGNASFTVAATGTGPLGYQWRKFGVPLAGATAATLNLAAVGLDAAGYYDVVVNDGLSLRVSPGAALAVEPSALPAALRPRAGFEPRVEFGSAIYAFAPLADGRFYAAGSFTTIDGAPTHGLARFLANGTVDPAFTAPVITGTILALAVQADGRVLLGGNFGYAGTRNSFRLARLNTDGTVDTSFEIGSGISGGNVNAIVVQPDQKILVGGAFSNGLNGRVSPRLIRLLADGTPDSTFTVGTGFGSFVNALALQTDGKILVGGAFTTYNGAPANRLARLNADGTLDTGFDVGAGFNNTVSALALDASGGIYAGGTFTTFRGDPAAALVRLTSAGARDTAFVTGTGFTGSSATVNALVHDGTRLVVGGAFTTYSGAVAGRLVRLDPATGALDATLAATLGTTGVTQIFFTPVVRALAVQAGSGQLLVGGTLDAVNGQRRYALARFNSDGTLDPLSRSIREPGQIYAVQPVPGGKVVVGGIFTFAGGVEVLNHLARFDATTGAHDPTFVAGNLNGTVRAIVRDGAGRLLVGGTFTNYQGNTVGRLIRVSADGALDTAYNAALGAGVGGTINTLALLPDGRLAVGGSFTSVSGTTANRLAVVNADGFFDAAFNTALGTGFNNTVTAIAAHPDGRLSVGGIFSTVNGASAAGLVRLAATGARDASFAVGTGLTLGTLFTSGTTGTNALALLPDGRLYVGGYFGAYNGTAAGCLVRLLPSGAVDPAFVVGNGFNNTVHQLLLQPDGRLIAAGNFTTWAGERRSGLARLSAAGALDLTFGAAFATGIPSTVTNALAFAPDGTLFLGNTGRMDFLSRLTGGLTLFETVPAPAFLTEPFPAAIPAGTATVNLGASVAGPAPQTFVWKKDGVIVTDAPGLRSGASTGNLVLAYAQAADAGLYTVTVTDGTGASITSAPVPLAVFATPPVFTSPTAFTFGPVAQAGSVTRAIATATGSTPTAITWTRDGAPVSGQHFSAGTSTLTLGPITPADAGVYRLNYTNALGSVDGPAARLWVAQEASWMPHNPLPSPQGLSRVFVADGLFHATGIRGVRLTSADGTTWAHRPALGQNNLFDTAEGNGRRVLLGSLGFTAVSTDAGQSWTVGTLGTGLASERLAFGAGLFVANAQALDGSEVTLSSPDGLTWTERHRGGSDNTVGLVYGNGVFLSLRGANVLRSADGLTWTSHAAPTPASFLAFANGQFFAASGDTDNLHVSTDGLAWTTRSTGATGALALDYSDGLFVMTGTNGLLRTSPDAVTWTTRTSGTTSALRGAAHRAGTWVVIGNQNFPATILTSTDNGATWTNRTTSVTFSHLKQLAASPTNLITVGPAGLILRTTNGTTWSTAASGVTDDLEGIAYGAGRFIATGANGRILTSTNATTWTSVTSGTTAFLSDARFLNNTFIAFADGGVVLRSTDGTTWSSATIPGIGANADVAIDYGAGRYVAVSENGLIVTSTDAATWTATTSGTTAKIEGIAYGNGRFLAPAGNAILTSTDGLAWTALPTPEVPGWSNGIIFVNGRFYTGTDSSIALLSSVDGVTWAPHHIGTSYGEINGTAVFNGRHYIVGDFGLIYSGALAPSIQQQPVGQVFAAGTPATFRVVPAGSALPVSYQWRKGGAPISGATSATYTIASPTAADQGNYDVVVSTSAGSATSAVVNLGVGGTLPTLEQQASFGLGTIVQARSVVDLQVNIVNGTPPVSVQWQKHGTNLGAPVAPDAAGIAHLYLLDAKPSDSGPYTAVATNASGSSSAVVNNQAQFIVNQTNWTWRHPYPQPLGFNGVAADGSGAGFVAFGPRGYIATSPDGAAWNQQRSVWSSIVRGYISGNGRHLFWGSASFAVGKFDDELVASNLGEFEFMNDVGFGQGLFVAVCASGRIFTSPDGHAWTERPSGTTESIVRVAHGAGTFVAITASGQLIRSADALTWSAPVSGPFTSFSFLKFVNDRFFLNGTGGALASSSDGLGWTTLDTGSTTNVNAVAYGAGRYHAVGASGRIITSVNGVDWTARTSGSTAFLTGIAFANNVWTAVSSATNPVTILTSGVDAAAGDNGTSWTNRTGSAAVATFNGVAANGTSSLIAVGTTGRVMRSTDGYQWNATLPAGNITVSDITHTGSAYVLVGDGGAVRRSTDDGATWTAPASGTTNHLRWVGRLNGQLHAAGLAGTLLTSTDGSAWTTVATGSTAALNGAAFGAGAYVLVGDDGTILRSTDGTAWSAVSSGVTAHLQEVAFGNSTFVAVGDAGAILTSSDGTAWTSRSFGLPEGFTHVTFTDGVFIVSGSPSGLFVSTDGVAWSARYTGNGGTATRLRAVAVFKGEAFAVGAGGAVMSAPLAPTSAIDPVSVAVATGGTARFQITPNAFVLPATYQWYRGGLPIPGATSDYFALPNARASDSGAIFSVTVTNAAGSYASDPALLTVAPTAYPGQLAADPTWDPNPLTISTRTFAAVRLPDGKFLVGGESVRWDGQPRTAVARLNADLSLDTTWTPPLINGIVYALAASPDGNVVYVGGEFTAVDGHRRSGLARLVGPGLSHDLTWRSLDPLPATSAPVSALALQDNLQLLVARVSFITGAVTGTNVLRRLNHDGTLDPTFSVDVTTAFAGQRIHSLYAEPGPDGKIAFAGSFTAVNGTARGGVARVNSSGATLDTVFGGTGANNTVNFLTRLADGRYVLGGNFSQVNSLVRNRVAVLTAATGAVDATFVPPSAGTTSGNAHSAVELSDGRLLVFGNFTRYSNNDTAGFLRLHGTTGAFDSAFTVGTGAQASAFNISGAGRNLHAFRLNDQDQVGLVGTFNQLLGQRRVAAARLNAGVSAADAADPAKSLVATPSALVHRPAFTGAAFLERNGALTVFGSADIAGASSGVGQILRVNADGSIDTGFPGGTGFGLNGLSTFGIYRAARQGDGKFLATGDFVSYNGATANRLVRINPDGTHDASFNAGSGPSNFIVTPVALSGGKVALFGGFGGGFTYNGTSVGGNLLRLNADGSRDTTFAVGTGFNSAPAAVLEFPFPHGDAIEESGKLLVGGGFTSYNGATVPGLVLLRPDGSRDTAFAPVGPTGGGIGGFVLLPDGRIVVHGSFTSFNGAPANRLAVIYSNDGALDPSFTSPAAVDAPVNQVVLQADGQLIVSGEFSAGPALRLSATGAVDPSFGLRGITGFPGGAGGARFILADDGSLYVHNTLVSLDYGAPRALVRFKGTAVAPTIAQAPHGGTFVPGSPFVLSVRAAGTAPYTYQWKRNDTAIDGATDSVYLIPSASAANAGNYTVVVTGPGGSVTSVPVPLAEAANVALRDQPVSRRVAAGATVAFAVSAVSNTAGATLTYQWRKDGNILPGLTADNLTLHRVTAANAGAYSVVVADGTATVTSQPAVLTVTTPDPVLWQQFTEFSAEHSPARTVHDGAGKVYFPWSIYDRAPDMANGKIVGALARFDENTGALDPSFRLDPRYRRASHAVVQPDGKLLVAVSVGDAHTVVRVTDTGAPDTVTPFAAPLFARGIRFITRQADGKVVVVAADNLDANAPASALGADAFAVYRLNANGSIDPDFTRATVNNGIFGPPVVDSTGRIYFAGQFNQVNGISRLGMARLTSTGALDSTFPSGLPAGFSYLQLRSVALQSGDRPVFVGDFFATGRGTAGDRIMALRFTSGGAYDNTFVGPSRSDLGLAAGLRLRHLIVEADDTILAVSDRVVRLTADGAKDSTFPSRAFGKEAFWISRGANNHLFFADQTSVFGQSIPLSTVSNGVAVISPNGAGASFSFQTGGWGRAAYPTDAAVLSDGRYWVAGNFNRLGATPVPGLALFEADGTPSTAQIGMPRSMAVSTVAPTLNDHVFALVGQPTNSSETGLAASLVRLTPNLTADSGFAPVLPVGYDLSTATLNPAPGGKLILAQGTISALAALNGAAGDTLIRLNSNGTRDTDYAPTLTSFAVVERSSANGPVTVIRTGGLNVLQVLPDGSALVVASALDGAARLQRLTPTGGLDSTFNAPSFGTTTPFVGFTNNLTDPVTSTTTQFPITTYSASDLIRTAVQMPDGKVYVGGRFQLSYSGAPRGLARLNANGTLDTTFTGTGIAFGRSDAGPYVSKLAVDSVGRLYLAGRFDTYNGSVVPGILRLRADGSFDSGWNPGFAVLDAPRADVNLIVAGDKLHAVGTVGLPGDTLPAFHRMVDIAPSVIARQDFETLVAGAGRLVTDPYSGFSGYSYIGLAPDFTLGPITADPIQGVLPTSPLGTGRAGYFGGGGTNLVPPATNTPFSVTAFGGRFDEVPVNIIGSETPIRRISADFVLARNGGTNAQTLSFYIFDARDQNDPATSAFHSMVLIGANNVVQIADHGFNYTPTATTLENGVPYRITLSVNYNTARWSARIARIDGTATHVLATDRSLAAGGYTLSGWTTPGTFDIEMGAVASATSKALLDRFIFDNLLVESLPDPAGSLNSVAPTSAAAGTVVTLGGFGFTGTTAVRFNGIDAAFTVVSDTQITATVPTFATTGAITVVKPAGTLTSASAFTVTAGPRLASLSTRARVGVGESAIVGSFTIEGTASQDVLLRAAGPALAAFGVAGTLADPMLTLHDATGAVVASNDDWPSALSSSFATVGAFGFTAGSKDAAIRATLAPGSYSARVTGAGATTGVALFELYEFASASRLSRLAVRQHAGTGADVSIVGFFYAGTSGTGKDTLVRAAGSSLSLPGALANPTLSLFAGSTTLGTNDTWGAAANVAALTASDAVTGGLPLATADAALYQRLVTGAYTAQVSGVGATTGLVSTEIFPIDGLRAATLAPALTAPLLDRTVVAGGSATFAAPHVALPAATYQWLKDGNALDGQTSATLVLAAVTEASAGNYAVRLANSAGTMTSAAAVLTVLSHHSADTTRDFALDLAELLRVIQLFNARAGNLRTGAYAVGTPGVEDGFAPDLVRTGSATLTRYHSADTNRDGRLSLIELTRVIELYNVRVGTSRTGQYRIQPGTEDGFGLGP